MDKYGETPLPGGEIFRYQPLKLDVGYSLFSKRAAIVSSQGFNDDLD
jgi:hypothetical protein